MSKRRHRETFIHLRLHFAFHTRRQQPLSPAWREVCAHTQDQAVARFMPAMAAPASTPLQQPPSSPTLRTSASAQASGFVPFTLKASMGKKVPRSFTSGRSCGFYERQPCPRSALSQPHHQLQQQRVSK